MKILKIGTDYYYYPQGISSLTEFIEYGNENFNSFISLVMLNEDNCVYPYFIAEETTEIYLNLSNVISISEIDATIYSKTEYETRLAQVIEKTCITCEHYEYDSKDNLKGHGEKLCLNGYCWGYTPKEK